MNKEVYMDAKIALLRINGKQKRVYKYHSHSAIYPFSNENIKKYYNKSEIEGKDILTVCSSGDHLFNAMLLGANSVDCFDINVFTKYYMFLKMGAIKCLKYEDFLNFFIKYGNKQMDKDIYIKFRDILDEEIKIFWDSIFNCKEGKKLRSSILFSDDENKRNNIIKCNNYLEPENYYILKRKLSKYNPIFYNLTLKNLADGLDDKKYDVMYLSNIAKYINGMFNGPGLIGYRNFILNELSNNLNEKGKIFLAYIYDYVHYDDGLDWYHKIDNFKDRETAFNSPEFETRIFEPTHSSLLYNKNDAVIIYKKELDKRYKR